MATNVTIISALVVISAIDLLLNFFFHLIQFKKFCDNEVRTAIGNLINRVDKLDRTIYKSQRDVQIELYNSMEHIKRIKKQIEEGHGTENQIEKCENEKRVENLDEYKEHSD